MALDDHNEDGYSLLLGDDPATGRPVYFRGEGSLATIAPQGSGKTQCHVLPNLLTWRGPALILDVTGELWRKTSRQRRRYGPVYKLDLENVEASDCYNPFAGIRRDIEHVWEDSQEFAELVFVRKGSGENHFFDQTGAQLLGAIACYVGRYMPDEKRRFEMVLDIAAGGEAMQAFIAAAKTKGDEVPALRNAAITLETADAKTKANVLYTAKAALSAWEGFKLPRITRIADWHPGQLRAENGTVYICASSTKLATHAGFVRLVVGQHVSAMLAERTDDTALPWFQFFLDEMPQLQKMPMLQRAFDVGRNHRMRLWMFMQYQAQLEEAYGEGMARGMVGACAIQAYMNPAFRDGTAEYLSKRLGTVNNPLEPGQRRPRVEPDVLAGPRFSKDVIVLQNTEDPVRLRKHHLYEDPYLSALTGESD